MATFHVANTRYGTPELEAGADESYEFGADVTCRFGFLRLLWRVVIWSVRGREGWCSSRGPTQPCT